jgi:hypothetical protein
VGYSDPAGIPEARQDLPHHDLVVRTVDAGHSDAECSDRPDRSELGQQGPQYRLDLGLSLHVEVRAAAARLRDDPALLVGQEGNCLGRPGIDADDHHRWQQRARDSFAPG